jgi:hypothetical protein
VWALLLNPLKTRMHVVPPGGGGLRTLRNLVTPNPTPNGSWGFWRSPCYCIIAMRHLHADQAQACSA